MTVMTKKIEKSEVAGAIRLALMASGRSRYEISQVSGVDQAALCRFVSGSGLRIESLEAIAKALGLEIRVVEAKKSRKDR